MSGQDECRVEMGSAAGVFIDGRFGGYLLLASGWSVGGGTATISHSIQPISYSRATRQRPCLFIEGR
jgi:hypothetical protein